ncbi:MAG: GlxA family transcriptional regulator [Sulfitobacter sp.]
MQHWKKSSTKQIAVGVLLFDGFSNHCLANAIEPLRAANRLGHKQHYEWCYLTINGTMAESSSGLKIVPHGRLDDAAGDLLLVMPSYGYQTLVGPTIQRGLRSAARRFSDLAGLDTGSWLLAQAGLLGGCCATIHWDVLTAFEETFPEVNAVRERFVVDGNRITCSGAMAAFDLSIHLIAQSHGRGLALEVEQLFMARETLEQRPFGMAKGRLAKGAATQMQANLEKPLSISQIAKQIGCSQKKLEQVMRRDFGATPQQVYRRLRLNLVRKLVEETQLQLSEVALRGGYLNASAMTRAFRLEFDMTPSEARDRAL